MKELDIGEVVRQSGVPASALRFYEEKGLIASIGRRGQRRVFAGDVLQRLALIALGFKQVEAHDAVRAALEKLGPEAGADALVRACLRR